MSCCVAPESITDEAVEIEREDTPALGTITATLGDRACPGPP